MGNRKQPFGYRVVMGEIALHPQESKLVEYIFQQYLVGATYNTLVEELREPEFWKTAAIRESAAIRRSLIEKPWRKHWKSEAQNRRQLPKRTRRSSSAASAGGHRQRAWSGRC